VRIVPFASSIKEVDKWSHPKRAAMAFSECCWGHFHLVLDYAVGVIFYHVLDKGYNINILFSRGCWVGLWASRLQKSVGQWNCWFGDQTF
jgi:hypothetical protein